METTARETRHGAASARMTPGLGTCAAPDLRGPQVGADGVTIDRPARVESSPPSPGAPDHRQGVDGRVSSRSTSCRCRGSMSPTGDTLDHPARAEWSTPLPGLHRAPDPNDLSGDLAEHDDREGLANHWPPSRRRVPPPGRRTR